MYKPNCAFAFLAVCFLLLLNSCKKDDNENVEPPASVEITDSVVVNNLNFPWDLAWGSDNHIWMTERSGKISRFNPATGEKNTVITVADVISNGEGGMLGLALEPGTTNVYVVYNYNNGGQYREKLVKYNFNGTTLVSPSVLIDDIPAASIHNGSRLVIDNGKIFMSTGDASNQSSAQNTGSRSGKILRLNLDGSIPTDNPVAGNPYWSFGHRNAQGLVMANGRLYSSEHGPDNDDEINIIEKGKNYGWPTVQGFCDSPGEQSLCGQTQEPIKAWTPTLAVSGMDYYNSDHIPQWKGSLLVATLKNTRMLQLKLGEDQVSVAQTNEYFNGKYGRMRDVLVSPEGKVYICTSNGGNNDKVIEIKRKGNGG
ncbi:MAG: glucose dehydrogenase [Citrobacter freundii]|nr:MAG: glucose dehydrogenase [Citrobacter freundii]